LIHFPSFVACSPSHKIAINKGEAAGGRGSLLLGGGLYTTTIINSAFLRVREEILTGRPGG